MPPPLDPDKRAAILADIQAIADEDTPDRSARSIAREHCVGHQSVVRLSAEVGLDHVWDRVQTKRATAARSVDMAIERATIKARLLEVAHDALDQLDEPYTVFSFGGKDNTYDEHELPAPTPEARRNLLTVAAIALDKHVALDRHDSEDQAEAGRSMIEGLAATLSEAYHRTVSEDDEVPSSFPAEAIE